MTPAPNTTRTGRRSKHPFTLLEILMAAAIVVVVALLIYKFFANMQNVWNASMSATNEHEDARLALEMMAADLQAAVAQDEDEPGGAIRFHQPGDSALWFVTVAAADSASACSMVEVGYRLNGQDLERAVVDESSSTWSIYGDRGDASGQGGYRKLIDGVIALNFECYDDALAITVPNQATQLPNSVTIRMTVLDGHQLRRWRQLPVSQRAVFEQQFCRTFWKSVRFP